VNSGILAPAFETFLLVTQPKGGMAKWTLRRDTTRQICLETFLKGVLIVVVFWSVFKFTNQNLAEIKTPLTLVKQGTLHKSCAV
jgi:hypothetical protein